jgi:hypothetical protein
MLQANEKKVWSKALKAVPAERQLSIEQFKALYDSVVAGKEKAYLIDTRTHPEFYAFHIPYTDHIHSGHMYTIPKKVKDKNAKIVVWCRTRKTCRVWLYQCLDSQRRYCRVDQSRSCRMQRVCGTL